MVTSLRDGSMLPSDILQATRHDRYLVMQRCKHRFGLNLGAKHNTSLSCKHLSRLVSH